jgi:hypothetical protein
VRILLVTRWIFIGAITVSTRNTDTDEIHILYPRAFSAYDFRDNKTNGSEGPGVVRAIITSPNFLIFRELPPYRCLEGVDINLTLFSLLPLWRPSILLFHVNVNSLQTKLTPIRCTLPCKVIWILEIYLMTSFQTTKFIQYRIMETVWMANWEGFGRKRLWSTLITNFRLSRQFTFYIDLVLGYLHRVDEGSVAEVSEAHTDSIFSVYFLSFCHLKALSVQRLYNIGDRMINAYVAVGGMKIGGGNQSTRRKPVPVALCPPQIPHHLTWDGTRAVAVFM